VLEQEPPLALPGQAALGRSPASAAGRTSHRRPPAALALLAAGLLLGGCSGVAEVTGTATQDDILQLRSDVSALQQRVQRSRTETETLTSQLEKRVREQTEQQTTAMTRRLDGLATTLTGLTAKLEELSARVDGLSRQARNGPPAARPGPLAPPPPSPTPPSTATATPPSAPSNPTGAGPATAAPVAPSTPAPPTAGPVPPTATPSPPTAAPTSPATAAPAPPTATPAPSTAAVPPTAPGSRPTTGSLQPNDIYQAAYIDFSKGNYPLAIAGFQEFLRRFPDHELAGSAQYWLGEANLSLGRNYTNAGQTDRATQALEQAVVEFKKVIANYPRGDKAPTALYKEALVLIELKQPALAQARLQYLIDNFPQAEETPLARERLSALKAS
jgi:tol-pal system protein YbgF